jgi:FeoB-associated Cys-rich membrane protein
MNTQEILTYVALVVAVGFLIKKFFFKKKKSAKNCGGNDCGCH